MGAVSGALRDAALAAGAHLRTGAEVVAIGDGEVRFCDTDGAEHAAGARRILANVAPAELDRLRGRAAAAAAPEGAQLKVNLLLARLPRLRDDAVAPQDAFTGTFHVNETATQLQAAYEQARAGHVPQLPPVDVYCHTLSDRTILGPQLAAGGAQTLTLFGLHMPARLFARDEERARAAALLRSLDTVLAEPIEDCLLRMPDGSPCIDVRTPLDLERELRLPGGNIFHRDLRWPFAEEPDEAARWGAETDDPAILLCGAGARRGAGVSAIAGRNAALAALAAG
jgi:phytoene dehydrogenase-like protein